MSSARSLRSIARSRLTRERKCLSVLHLGHIQSHQDSHSPLRFGFSKVPQHGVMGVARFLPNRSCAHAVSGQHLESRARCIQSPGSTLEACSFFRGSMATAPRSLIMCILLSVVLRCAGLTTLRTSAARLIHLPTVFAPLHRLPLSVLAGDCGGDCCKPGVLENVRSRLSGSLVDFQGGQRRRGIKFDGFPWLVHDAASRIPTSLDTFGCD